MFIISMWDVNSDISKVFNWGGGGLAVPFFNLNWDKQFSSRPLIKLWVFSLPDLVDLTE